MNNRVFYLPNATAVMREVRRVLIQRGGMVSDVPCPAVTHLLLSIPSLESDGQLKGGGTLEGILHSLPPDITIIGGNLDAIRAKGCKILDLLKDENYLWENAAITADCALQIARVRMGRIWQDCPVLILGWGRIGKHLGRLLRSLGADVSIAARRPADRAMISSFGYQALEPDSDPSPYQVIFNTAPAMLLPAEKAAHCRPDCLKIDLASTPGIGGSDVIWARGLPGKDAPTSAGELIAKTVLTLTEEKEGSV